MITCEEMKKLEKQADCAGLSYLQMMENAGKAATDYILERTHPPLPPVYLFCGKGNNGGDGYVVGRLLHNHGFSVTLIALESPPTTPCSHTNYQRFLDLGLSVETPSDFFSKKTPFEKNTPPIMVDALYGTGFHGELDNRAKKMISFINQAPGEKISLDLPSGLNGDNQKGPLGTHVHADCTITFHDEKPIHGNPQAQLGRVRIAPIGIREALSSENHHK